MRKLSLISLYIEIADTCIHKLQEPVTYTMGSIDHKDLSANLL